MRPPYVWGALIKREPARADKTDLHWLNRLLILESNCTLFPRAMTFFAMNRRSINVRTFNHGSAEELQEGPVIRSILCTNASLASEPFVIGVLKGEGVGAEVVDVCLHVLDAVSNAFAPAV